MRGALIGCGFFAQNHLNAWRDLSAEGVTLAAICDLDAAKGNAAREAFGVPSAYTDAEAMLAAERLDFVDIATQMQTHLALVRAAARHGVNIIVQTPPAPAWPDAKEIVEVAAKAGVRLAVHENFRFQAPMRRLKSLLDGGAIGTPSWARIAFRTGYDVYRAQPYFHREMRLAILDVGIHVLDPDPFQETLVAIEGDGGAIQLGPGLRGHVANGGRSYDLELGAPLLGWTEQPWRTVQESVLLTQRSIIDAWRANRDAETDGEDNLQTFALVEAAYEAAQTGHAVAPARS